MSEKPTKAADIEQQAKQSIFMKMLAGRREIVSSIQAHPVWGIVYIGIAIIVGIIGNISYDYFKSKYLSLPIDQYLVDMREAQDKQYKDLKNSLRQLSGSISGGSSSAEFKTVTKYSEELVLSNKNLINQLTLAKRENDSLSKAAQKNSGVSGGYDFILNEGSSMRIDDSTVVGVADINPRRSATVNISANETEDNISKHVLRPGESVQYKNSVGKSCKISILTIDKESASFANNCT